jgi:FHS family L-fucose permease-like MFS transporter
MIQKKRTKHRCHNHDVLHFCHDSFVTNLAAPFGTIWKNQYEGANTLGMMGNMMNFLAYLFMGIPAGNMLVKNRV